MASKFMKIKKVVIPLITLVILVSQISGCAIMNRDDATGILADNDEVVVEYAEPDENAGADGVAGQIDNSVPEDTSEDLEDTEDAEIGVVDNIGTLDEGDTEGAGEVEQVGETEAPETPEVETPVEAEPTYSFTSVNETVYATSTVNIREGFSADTDKVGSLGKGQSIKRVGIGTGDAEGWSQVEFNGQTAYISSEYLSTVKPTAPSSSNSGSQTSQSSSGGQTQQPSQPSSGQSSGNQSSSGGSGGLTEEELGDLIRQQMEQNNEIGNNGELTQESKDALAGSINLD